MGWSSLPRQLLFNIADRFTVIDDYDRFGRVCPSWKSIVEEIFSNKMFMVIAPRDDPKRSLYNISKGRMYDMELELPKAGCHFVGAAHGWLITLGLEPGMEGFFWRPQLQNPFCNRTIPLPCLPRDLCGDNDHGIYHGFVWKAALSRAPSDDDDDFVVMAIINGDRDLAYYKPGNQTWTYLSSVENEIDYDQKDIIDVIFFHKTKQFYALIEGTNLIAVDFTGEGEPEITRVMHPTMFPEDDYDDYCNVQLVEDKYSESLLKIDLHVPQFCVLKLNPVDRCWVRIDDMGENVLFLTPNNAILRAASDCPGYKPNCIHYLTPTNGSIIYQLGDCTARTHLFLPSEKMESCAWLEMSGVELPQLLR